MDATTNKNAIPKSQGNTPDRVQDSTAKVAGMIFGSAGKQPVAIKSGGRSTGCKSCGE